MRQYIIPVILIIATLGAWIVSGFYFRTDIRPVVNQPPWGQPAPAFELPRLDDLRQVVNPESLKGDVYLLNFWASWCVSCKQEHQFLLSLAKQQRVKLYSVNYMDSRQAAQAVLQKSGNPYLATAFDAQGMTTQPYGVIGTPITFVIDKQGLVRYKHLGPLNKAVFEQIIDPLLTELEKV